MALYSSHITGGTNLDRDSKVNHLLNLIIRQKTAVSQSVRFEIDHLLAFFDLFFRFTAMKGNLETHFSGPIKF